jgi:TPR repeat protein
MGLSGLLIIIAILYFTGAGAWLWDRVKELEGQCYGLTAQVNMPSARVVCNGIGSAVRTADDGLDGLGDKVVAGVKEAWFRITGGKDLTSAIGDVRISGALEKLGGKAQDLRDLQLIGPQGFSGTAPASERLANALQHFRIGQQYLANDGSSADRAMPWLQQGANNPGYGVLSQLSLGDIYSKGYGTVGANPAAAKVYYQQASQSISILQSANTPEAQQLLKSLPSSPQNVQLQLQQIIGGINGVTGKR